MLEQYYLVNDQGFLTGCALLTQQQAKDLGATQVPPAGRLLDENHCPRLGKNGWADDSTSAAKKVFAEHHHTPSPFDAQNIG
jgi:hypothetical protein